MGPAGFALAPCWFGVLAPSPRPARASSSLGCVSPPSGSGTSCPRSAVVSSWAPDVLCAFLAGPLRCAPLASPCAGLCSALCRLPPPLRHPFAVSPPRLALRGAALGRVFFYSFLSVVVLSLLAAALGCYLFWPSPSFCLSSSCSLLSVCPMSASILPVRTIRGRWVSVALDLSLRAPLFPLFPVVCQRLCSGRVQCGLGVQPAGLVRVLPRPPFRAFFRLSFPRPLVVVPQLPSLSSGWSFAFPSACLCGYCRFLPACCIRFFAPRVASAWVFAGGVLAPVCASDLLCPFRWASFSSVAPLSCFACP